MLLMMEFVFSFLSRQPRYLFHYKVVEEHLRVGVWMSQSEPRRPLVRVSQRVRVLRKEKKTNKMPFLFYKLYLRCSEVHGKHLKCRAVCESRDFNGRRATWE